MSDEAPPSSDRRRAVRHIACFPSLIELPHDAEKVTAMIVDLAETGSRLLLRNPGLSIGDELRLELHVLLDGGAPRIATGRVVRVEGLPDDRVSLWTHEVGVDFHERLALGAAELEALQKRQAPFGKHP
ncbi:MAG TPA: PilZ domain-containing protein [Polyangiaceae bacterium]|jgi:hypothetical protein